MNWTRASQKAAGSPSGNDQSRRGGGHSHGEPKRDKVGHVIQDLEDASVCRCRAWPSARAPQAGRAGRAPIP